MWKANDKTNLDSIVARPALGWNEELRDGRKAAAMTRLLKLQAKTKLGNNLDQADGFICRIPTHRVLEDPLLIIQLLKME